MECKTIKSFNKRNKPIFEHKIKHSTFEIAQNEANRINNLKKTFIKRVIYKCSKCDNFHVGTSFEMLENNNVSRGWHQKLPKVVGNIDLAQFEKKIKVKIISPPKNTILKSGLIITPHIKKLKDSKFSASLWVDGNRYEYQVKEKSIKLILPLEIVKLIRFNRILKQDDMLLTSNKIKRHIINFARETNKNKLW